MRVADAFCQKVSLHCSDYGRASGLPSLMGPSRQSESCHSPRKHFIKNHKNPNNGRTRTHFAVAPSLQFPNAVVLNAVGRRNAQMRAKDSLRAQTQERKRAQKGAMKGGKRALPRKKRLQTTRLGNSQPTKTSKPFSKK